jgi:hypothetical protein
MWINDDESGQFHITAGGNPFDLLPRYLWFSGPMTFGETFSVTFKSPGDVGYFCSNHPLNKFGNILVGGTGVQIAFTPRDIGNVRDEFDLPSITSHNNTSSTTSFLRLKPPVGWRSTSPQRSSLFRATRYRER